MGPENEFDKIQLILMPALRTGGFAFSLSLIVDVCIDLWLTFFTLGEETGLFLLRLGQVNNVSSTEDTGHRKQDKHTKANCVSSMKQCFNLLSLLLMNAMAQSNFEKGIDFVLHAAVQHWWEWSRDWRRVWTGNHGGILQTDWLSCLWMTLCV